MRYASTLAFWAILFIFPVTSQDSGPVQKALDHILEKKADWGLEDGDIEDLLVSDFYQTAKTGTQHVYINQTYQGVPVYNAIQTITIDKNGKVYSGSQSKFHGDLQEKIATMKKRVSPGEAILKLSEYLKNPLRSIPELKRSEGDLTFIFSGEGIAKSDISVKLFYQPVSRYELRLAYQVQFDPVTDPDWWNARVDAETGEILAINNHTVKCRFEKMENHSHDNFCDSRIEVKTSSSEAVSGGQYRVLPFPVESPSHGAFQLTEDPAQPDASPFGWHDTNGVDGPEYTITRGNNVHAFQDRNDSNSSSNDEPEGGQNLVFDYTYAPSDDPADYSDAAVVNLFYWVNTVHDFSHLYGFDETAGNFQQTNYSGLGLGGDYLLAHAQDGFGLPTPNTNNAYYSGSEDGTNSTIAMFVWDDNVGGGAKYVTVTEPEGVAGGYPSVQAQFGADVPIIPIVAEVVEYNDGIYQPYITDACEPANDPSSLAGKIALVDRGGCFFEQKTVWAQEAGAVAIIICNFEEDPMGMAGVPDLVGEIPTVSMGATDCATIRVYAGNGLTVSLGQPATSGPDFLDGDFDNGIIAHEYAHGISNRLTGGPGSATCLFNAEQMGEGWSDFFSLIMSVQPGDSGDTPRGVGTYVFRQENEGRGIRRFPYSTDMDVNPLTLVDVAANTEVHALGEVWTAVLWDLYWALTEQYDFDPDLMNGSGGNNLAVQLVMDGMKIQDCLPGFIEGRDGILTADQILTGGVNQCLIWEVFARRGMGFGASQGSSLSASDQIASFEPLPPCVEELKMDKSLTPLVGAGENIEVSIALINHKPETQTGVQVIDQLPDGLTYVDGSANFPVVIDGDLLTFDIGNLIFNEEQTLTYQVETDPSKPSIQQHFDGLETGTQENWAILPVEGTNEWAISQSSAYEGNQSFKVESVITESQQIVFTLQDFPIVGAKPTLRFYHNYDTEHGQDGGVVQVTDDIDLGVWQNLGDLMVRGEYQGPLDYQTFVIPNFQAFYGESNGYTSSYIDLSPFLGKELYFRYNFGTSDGDGPVSPSNGFWEFDNFEIMDLVHYNWETCLSNDSGFSVCETASDLGTVVESEVVSSVNDLLDSELEVQVFPNPAKDFISIGISSNSSEVSTIGIYSVNGKLLKSKTFLTNGSEQQEIVHTQDLLPGFYFVRVDSGKQFKTKKLIIQ